MSKCLLMLNFGAIFAVCISDVIFNIATLTGNGLV